MIGVDVDGVRGRTVAGHLSGRVTEPRGTLKGRGEAKMHGMIRLYILLLLFSCSVVRAQSEKNAADEFAAPSLQTMAGEASAGPEKSGILFRTEQGELIPLSSLLGPGVVDELLQRSVQQLSVPDYTIARMEIRAAIDRDVAKLHVEMEVQVRADGEWISVPLAFGDVYLTEFRHDSEVAEAQSVLKAGEQNLRQWHLKGRGLHTLSFDLVGRARAVGPGVSQLNLTIPTATASHAVAEFSAPVELQRLPTGAVDKVTRDERGVRSVEFWGLSGSVALTWAEVAPPVASRPVVQVQNRIKLDLTTIPVSLTGTQTLQISGAPLSEVHVSYPDGFQLKEVNARNAANASVMNNFEILPGTGPSQALIRLTTAVEGNLTLQFDLELMNRAFPQDIRVAIPSVKDANMKLKKGQYVDVELTVDNVDLSSPSRRRNSTNRRPNMSSSDAMTATLFKGVKVLEINKSSVNSSIQNAGSPSQSVTLELDEEQSRIALLAQKKGEIDLIYSNNGPGTGGISIEAREEDRIFFMEILGLRLQEEKQPFEAEHYRGQSFSNTFFEDGRRLNTGTSGGSGNSISPGGGGRRSSSTDDGLTVDDLAGSPPDTETDMAETPTTESQSPN